MSEAREENSGIRYQPDEDAPAALSAGMGLQYAALHLSGMMMITIITFRAAGVSDAVFAWGVFVSVVIGGLCTALQSYPIARVGAGYILAVGPISAVIAVSVDALVDGGPALLATLMVASALVQLLFAARLSLFRRVITPTVSGTVLMLVPVTVLPSVFDLFDEVPAGHGVSSALAPGLVTAVVVAAGTLGGGPRLRAWAPVAGIVLGSVVAVGFGTYDTARVASADWIGFPAPQWPGLDLEFGPSFWALLPAFLLVHVVTALRSISATLALQGVAWRQERAVDFRAVQGGVFADTVSNFMAAFSGTIANGTRSTTAALTRITGVGARSVGVVFGLSLVLMAFSPKLLALVLAVPGPVIAGYVTVAVATLFVIAVKMVAGDSDPRLGVVAALSFWIGLGCQYGFIFPEYVEGFAGGLLGSGITAGGLLAILLTLALEATGPRRRRMEAALGLEALDPLRDFVRRLATDSGWSESMAQRLDAACEETLLTLTDHTEAGDTRRLRVTAARERDVAVLEFIAVAGETNIEDQISLLGERAEAGSLEREASLRLLRSLASEVSHRQYHEVDIVTVRVNQP